MYKLTAITDKGVKFIFNSAQIPDLQRIAASLEANEYSISLHGSVVMAVSMGV